MKYSPLLNESVPKNWEIVRLKDVSTYISRGKQPKYVSESNIYALNQKAIRWNSIQEEHLKFQNPDISVMDRHFIKKNDVVINSTGVGTVGRAYHFNNTPRKKIFADSHVTIVRTNETRLNSQFLYYQISDTRFQSYINNTLLAGSTGQVELNKTKVEGVEILLPDLAYQKKIVSILSVLDFKIELNNQIISTLEELASTLFKRWFVDFEFPDENGNPYKSSGGKMVDSELGDIPEGWEVSKLSSVAEIKTGKRPKVKKEFYSVDYPIPIIGASKVMGYTNDLLESSSILTTGRVGTHGIIQRFRERTWVSDNSFIIKSEFEEFTYQYLLTINFNNLNRGSTQPLITQTDLKKLPVIMPEIGLLEKYGKLISPNTNYIFSVINQNRVLESVRDTLLPKLLSGEIEIPQGEDV